MTIPLAVELAISVAALGFVWRACRALVVIERRVHERHVARDKEARQIMRKMLATEASAKRILVATQAMDRKVNAVLLDPAVEKALNRAAETGMGR